MVEPKYPSRGHENEKLEKAFSQTLTEIFFLGGGDKIFSIRYNTTIFEIRDILRVHGGNLAR